jgi:flagellar biosynthesis/type III secretory pathway chaperone
MEEEALEQLIAILGRETDLLQELHTLLAAQQQALVRNDVEDIKQSVEGQIATLSEISKLERERVSLLGAIHSGEADDRGDVTLSHLIEVAPEHGGRLREVRTALKDVLDAIGTLNKHNGMLINQSLSYIGKTLRTIAGEDTSSTVYTSDGDLTCPTGRLAVDRKI